MFEEDKESLLTCLSNFLENAWEAPLDICKIVAEYVDMSCVAQFHGHSGRVVALSTIDKNIISGGCDNTLRLWKNDGTQLKKIQVHIDVGYCTSHACCIACLLVLPEGLVIARSGVHTLVIWNPNSPAKAKQLDGHSGWIRAAIAVPAHDNFPTRVVSGAEDRSLIVWDPFKVQLITRLMGHAGGIWCMAFLNNHKSLIATGSFDTTIRIWDIDQQSCLQILSGHTECVLHLTVIHHPIFGNKLTSASFDRTLRVWNLDTPNYDCIHTFSDHTKHISALTAVKNRYIVSASVDRSLRTWDVVSGKSISKLEGHTGRICCLVTLPNGKVVSGGDDSTIRIWDVINGKHLQTLEGHTNCVWSLAVLPTECIISGSWDNTIRVWGQLKIEKKPEKESVGRIRGALNWSSQLLSKMVQMREVG